MFAILLSAVNVALGFVFKSVIVKFVLFFGLWFVTTEFIAVLTPLMPGASTLSSAFTSQYPGVWYLINFFRFDYGIPALLSALTLRFAIRRIPLIG